MQWIPTAVIVVGVVVVLIRFLVFLRVMYRDGQLHWSDRQVARTAQLLPLLILVIVLGVEMFLIDRFPLLVPWIPVIIPVTALVGALAAVERARRAVIAKREARGE